jgi:large subunit ribosomal protein L21
MNYVIVYLSGKQFILSFNNWEDICYLKKRQKNSFFFYLHFVLIIRNLSFVQIGKPFLSNINLPIKELKVFKNTKVIIFKYKAKKNYKKKFVYKSKSSRILLFK